MYWIMKTAAPGDSESTYIEVEPEFLEDLLDEDFDWTQGVFQDRELPESLDFYVDPDEGDFIPPFFTSGTTLMTEKMVNALMDAGVDNIQTYKANLHGFDGEVVAENYLIFNIVGRIECADLEKSKYKPLTSAGMRLIFMKLVIDQEKAKNALMFRLHESPTTVIVHDSVKTRLEKENIAGLKFIKASE